MFIFTSSKCQQAIYKFLNQFFGMENFWFNPVNVPGLIRVLQIGSKFTLGMLLYTAKILSYLGAPTIRAPKPLNV
jgi:hypothetical protein